MASRAAAWRLLDRALNVAIVLASSVVVLFAIVERTGPAKSNPSTISVNQQIGGVTPGIEYATSKATLLVLLNSSCRYCTESLPVIRGIAEGPCRLVAGVRCLAVGVEDFSVLRAYLKANAVRIEAAQLPANDWTHTTPRMVIVDQGGVVRREWLGRLDAAQGAQIVEALERVH